ncbi:MAG: DUF1211 domain-containing protein [Chitinophagaceae bacterium]|nr:DUF1211 domain-containing protein [Chitinophagaceae bacterium]
MLRKKIFQQHESQTTRGTELYRIEALSDAVFAFSVSLLIMSLEVPKTFEELNASILHFLPFAATVSLVFFFWYLQNAYFRNYGLNDGKVIFLNLSLLVLILFYAFPLKFLFSVLLSWLTGIDYFHEESLLGKTVLTEEEFPQLILFFSIGYAVIWFIFYLLYRHAYVKRSALKFSMYEIKYLQSQKQDAMVQVAIGLLSILFAFSDLPVWSGFCFLLIPVWLLVHHYLFRRTVKRIALLK